MGVTITRDQRDAIYAAGMNHLSVIAYVWLAVERQEFTDAQRLGRNFTEDVHLRDDLGWRETTDRETVPLPMPTPSLPAPSLGCTGTLPARSARYVSRPKEDEAIAERERRRLLRARRRAEPTGRSARRRRPPRPGGGSR